MNNEELLNKCIKLFVNRTLEQYGLDERASLEIVSNLTGIPREQLVEIRNKRDMHLNNEMKESFETVKNIITK